jgi:hypothetical protein
LLLGLLISWAMSDTALLALRAHVAAVLDHGLLETALGAEVRHLFPRLYRDRYERWPQPEAETAEQRVRTFRRHYSSCARRNKSTPWPAGWFALGACGWVVTLLLCCGAESSNVNGRNSPYQAADWALAIWEYLRLHPPVAVASCATLSVLVCLGVVIALLMQVALVTELADALEQLARSPELHTRLDALRQAASADPQVGAFDDISSGWS